MHIRFIDAAGNTHLAEGEVGESAMRCATRALIPGIIGECGGAMACATCHAYVTQPNDPIFHATDAQEREMLGGCIDVRPNSRLTCQVTLTAQSDGMTFTIPASQV